MEFKRILPYSGVALWKNCACSISFNKSRGKAFLRIYLEKTFFLEKTKFKIGDHVQCSYFLNGKECRLKIERGKDFKLCNNNKKSCLIELPPPPGLPRVPCSIKEAPYAVGEDGKFLLLTIPDLIPKDKA